MTRRFSRRPAQLPRDVQDTLRRAQDAQTIGIMLSNGASVTPIEPRSILRLPGSDRCQEFPTELVEEALKARRSIEGRSVEPGATASGFSEAAGREVAGEGEKPLAAPETRARGHRGAP